MRIIYNAMLSHGSGALRQLTILWTWNSRTKALRFSVGGYGNVCPPAGQWCLLPSTTRYPGTAYYLNWLNMSLSYLPRVTGSYF
jgi:hypothetical protein